MRKLVVITSPTTNEYEEFWKGHSGFLPKETIEIIDGSISFLPRKWNF